MRPLLHRSLLVALLAAPTAGLLFAGSVASTIINRIQNAFQALELSLP